MPYQTDKGLYVTHQLIYLLLIHNTYGKADLQRRVYNKFQ